MRTSARPSDRAPRITPTPLRSPGSPVGGSKMLAEDEVKVNYETEGRR
ncbi:MAG: hypothetical protein WCA29_03745 [Jiangellales bacterium]